jgi:epsilon-lactone hydrolase
MIRKTVRRRLWGKDELDLARNARQVFGSPRFLQALSTSGLDVSRIDSPAVAGEWLRQNDSASKGRAILYIHGGGFVSCSARTHRPITTALCRRTGLTVFAVDYRLAPEDKFPSAIDDVTAAYQWLGEQGHSRIAVAGDSAGGGLVMSLLLRVKEKGLPSPACAVCFSPLADLAGTGASYQFNADKDAMFYPENVHEYAAAYLGDVPPTDPRVSPVYADLTGLPPVLFQVGSTELLLDDSRRMHDSINAAGGRSELEIYEDLPHCWQMLNPFVPEAGRALGSAAEFIRRHISSN